MNNYWGPPDDDMDMPDWMKASTYQNGGQPKIRKGKSLEQIAEEVLKKPAVPVIIREPKIGDDNG